MLYITFVSLDETEVPHSGPIDDDDEAYLRQIIATLRPISDEEYMNGPAIFLHTFAHYGYVLDGETVYWCVEWDPGLVVIRFSPDQPLSWSAIRSPVPTFGGREAAPEDLLHYDEDAENPQYNLVFTPWDAQFSAQKREWCRFVPADADVQARFARALDHVNSLGDVMERRFSGESAAWMDRCKRNLNEWCGEGIRLG